MTATVSGLRLVFPEFGDRDKFPDPMLSFWLSVAVKLVNAERWGELTETGVYLQAAHRVVLARREVEAGARGQSVGRTPGILTSKSADGLSASYDVSSVLEEGGGHYNLTTYGIQFVQLARLHGHGGIQAGAGGDSGEFRTAWPGVITPPF